jgi:hypothetical protein
VTGDLDLTAVPDRPSTSDGALSAGPGRPFGRLRRLRRARTQTAVAIIATALPALLGVAACGGGQSGPAVVSRRSTGTAQLASGSPGQSTSNSAGSPAQEALAFARCMRHHGIAEFPDPDSSGNFPPGAKQVSLRNPHQFQEAVTACRSLLPDGGNGPTPAQWQQILTTVVSFAHCMRRHGVPNWPDPRFDTHGRPVFSVNVDPNSPQFTEEIQDCKNLLVNYGSRLGWPNLSNYFERSQG